MVRVVVTPHLHRFFPMLAERAIAAPPGSVAQVLEAVEAIAPGFRDYVLDERGALRRHVSLSIDNTVLIDRRRLSDRVPDGGTVFIFQALSGG